MKPTEKRVVRSGAVFALTAILGISSSLSTKVNNNTTDSLTLGSGVANVLHTDGSQVLSLTAGAASVLNDYSKVAVSDNDSVLVAAAASTEETTTEETTEVTSICGFTNIGICVVEGNLNVRDAASTDGNVVGKMTNHAACEILGTEGDWTYISSGNVEGYVMSSYLITGDEARSIALAEKKLMATVTCDVLRVRQAPTTDSDVIINVSNGEDVEVASTDVDGWVQVNIDNDTGYVSSEFVELSEKLTVAHTLKELYYGDGVSDSRVSLCNYALEFVGNPYVWGGTSLTRGADCSGFVLSIYAQYGISLPHSSRAQANYGTRISASEAKPGDLFFYGSGSSISHVAIYIGNGQIVHASTESTGIIVSNAYYRNPICVVSLLGN